MNKSEYMNAVIVESEHDGEVWILEYNLNFRPADENHY